MTKFPVDSRAMNAATIFLVLAIGLANGQLNFEGNPLTENTEYAAVESRFTEKTARRQETAANVTGNSTESSQNFQLLSPDAKNSSQSGNPAKSLDEGRPVDQKDSWHAVKQQKIGQTGRYLATNNYNQGTSFANHSDLALNSFLNSKTPEESRLSLDYYLESRKTPQNVQPMIAEQQQLTQQPVARVDQQPVSSPVNQQLTAQLMQQRHVLQALPVNQPAYSAAMSPMDLQSSVSNPAAITVMQQQQAMQPYMTGIQARKDAFYPGWYQRVRRVRGKPFPYVQSRGGPGFYGGPVPPGEILLPSVHNQGSPTE